jgi:hypothetical protein
MRSQVDGGGGGKAKTGTGGDSGAVLTVHYTDVHPSSCLHTKASRIKALTRPEDSFPARLGPGAALAPWDKTLPPRLQGSYGNYNSHCASGHFRSRD